MNGSGHLQPAALGRVSAPALRVELDGRSLSLQAVAAVSRSGAAAQLTSSARTLEQIDASRRLKEELIAASVPVYGVTTGFGDSADQQIDAAQAVALQRGLVRMMGCGAGDFAPLDEARATSLIRANCLARGHSGVRRLLIDRLLTLLNAGVVPAIRERGSVGASGDLVPLSYVAAMLEGERQVFFAGKLQPSSQAMAALGLEPLRLESKEALALLNGTAYMAGVACLAAFDAESLALAADVCTALTAEALESPTQSFSRFVHDIAKPHRGSMRSAGAVRALLEGSSHVSDTGLGSAPSPASSGRLPRHVQDRYSVRCAPHFIGALWDTLSWVNDWLTTEINASTDNPLLDVDARESVNGGNFAGSHVGLAMDALRTALASVADLLDRQLALVVDDRYSRGLPANLTTPLEARHPEHGIRHGFKGVQIACSSFVAEALQLCSPVTVHSRSTECHNQDKVSMASIASRRTRDVVRLTELVIACHLLVLCQAAELRGAQGLGHTRLVVERVRAVSPTLGADRELESDITRVAELVRGRSLFEGLPMAALSRET